MADISKVSIDGGTTEYNIKDATARTDLATLNGKIGANNGIATLNGSGKVPESQLPSYVDDVIEGYLYEGDFYEDAQHTELITGETGKIYVDLETDKTYRWSGSVYIPVNNLEIGDTAGTAFEGSRGKAIENKIPSGASSTNKLTTIGEVDEKLLNGHVVDSPNLFNVDDIEIGVAIDGTANADKARVRIPCLAESWYSFKQFGSGTFAYNVEFHANYDGSDVATTTSITPPAEQESSAGANYIFLEFGKTGITKADVVNSQFMVYKGVLMYSPSTYTPYFKAMKDGKQDKMTYKYANNRLTLNSIAVAQ